MKFIENNTYTLQTDYYNSVKVVCTYVEDNTVWFKSSFSGHQIFEDSYKLNRKTNKLYKLNNVFSSWDSVENTLSEESVDDLWSKRMSNGSDYYYYGVGQD